MRNISNSFYFAFLLIFSLAALSYSSYLAVAYASQLLLDFHEFRQTQTALTSYWFIQQGFQLAYETPVGGAPWTMPLEFPIYQAIVAYISGTFDLSLHSTGRLVSYTFLLLTIIPVVVITKRLNLPKITVLYFVSILFSMPIYIYWGRAFLIETTALFFGVVAIKFFLDYLLGSRSIFVSLAFIVFATLSILQKSTTAIPILVVLSIVFFITELKRYGSLKSLTLFKNLLIAGIIFLIPIAIGFAWVVFSDSVKLEGTFSETLLKNYNVGWVFGSILERFSYKLWAVPLGKRIFLGNLGFSLGLFLLILPFFVRPEAKTKFIVLGSIFLGIFPLILFPRLHIVHDYYQTANAIFFAYGVSVALAVVVAPTFGKRAALVVLLALMVGNYISLRKTYLPVLKQEYTKEFRDLAIGKILNRELPPGMQFVAFGNDWSSTFAYFSERKSFTVPYWWYKNYDQVISNPEKFLDEGHLGGIVSCEMPQAKKPTISQLFDWADNNGSWKVGETHGCLVFTPEKKFSDPLIEPAQCQGIIDRADIELRDDKEFVVFTGWFAGKGEKYIAPDDIILKISRQDTVPMYLQTLKVPRLDVSRNLQISDDFDIGFSRIIENKFDQGNYDIELMYVGDGDNKLRSCGIHTNMQIK